MQTVALDLTLALQKDRNDLAPFLSSKAIRPGDKLLVLKNEALTGASLVAGMALVFMALYDVFKKEEGGWNGQDAGERSFKDNLSLAAMGQWQTPEEAQTAIEQNLGVEIELVNQDVGLQNPFAETFGIWKNQNFDVDSFRDQAWRKAK